MKPIVIKVAWRAIWMYGILLYIGLRLGDVAQAVEEQHNSDELASLIALFAMIMLFSASLFASRHLRDYYYELKNERTSRD